MKVLFGAKEDLSEPDVRQTLQNLGQLSGISGMHVSEVHPHMIFIEFDGNRLQRTDIISYMDHFGVHARSLGC